MKKSLPILTCVAVVATLMGLPTAASAAVPEPATEHRIALDDFSQYADDAALSGGYSRNAGGGANEVTLVDSPFGADNGKAMAFTYTFLNGYTGRSRSVDGYWPGLKAVELSIQNGTPGQDILLQLSDGLSYEAHLDLVPGYAPDSTAPQHLRIPVEAFAPKSGTGTLSTRGVVAFALYVNQRDAALGGSFILDNLNLVFDEAPVLPEVSFASTDLVADGASNLLTLLNREVTAPAGSSIVQARWASSNPAVLAGAERFAPKGDFLSEGSSTVTLRDVKLFHDGTTFTIPVAATLTVAVSEVAAAVDVVDYLRSVTGHGTISAMHHDRSYAVPANTDVLHQRVANQFGVYPGLYSADFLTGPSVVPYRQNMIDEVTRQWRNGNLTQIMFHVSPPQYTVAQEIEGDWGGDQAHETLPSPNRIFSYLYNDQWTELMTDGTELNRNWKLRMDEYARFLQHLEDAGVSVMLRPFHEMNQHVFWWGGRPGLSGSAGLYRMFHDYMEKEKGLSNIIWVWNIQDLPDNYGWADGDAKFDRYEGLPGGLAEYDADNWESFSPGKDYYDVLSVDFYDVLGYQQRHYEHARDLAETDGKPMIIGETFTFPTPAELTAQPDWALVMPWGARTWNFNTPEAMATFYQNSIGAVGLPRFRTRDNAAAAFSVTSPAGGAILDTATTAFAGTGVPGASVRLAVAEQIAGTATVGSDGRWTLTPASALPLARRFDATLTQVAHGNTAVLQVAGLGVPIPKPTVTSPANGAKVRGAVRFTGAATPGATITVTSDDRTASGVAAPDGSWSVVLRGPVKPGVYEAVVRATLGDAEPALSTATLAWRYKVPVGNRPTTLAAAARPSVVRAGQTVKISVVARDRRHPAQAAPTGDITVYGPDGSLLDRASVKRGSATLEVSVPADAAASRWYALRVVYSGDTKFHGARTTTKVLVRGR